MRNQRDIKLATTERQRKYLASEPNYHIKKCLAENLSAKEMKKPPQIIVYLWLSIQELSKKLMYEFCVAVM